MGTCNPANTATTQSTIPARCTRTGVAMVPLHVRGNH